MIIGKAFQVDTDILCVLEFMKSYFDNSSCDVHYNGFRQVNRPICFIIIGRVRESSNFGLLLSNVSINYLFLPLDCNVVAYGDDLKKFNEIPLVLYTFKNKFYFFRYFCSHQSATKFKN